MSQLHKQIPAMLELAYERTESSRIELAGMLADVFLKAEADLSLREQELINELIDLLMQSRSPVVRAQLVERFADMSRMPRRIAVNFAHDAIETAGPILTYCPNLTDEDLISVVESESRDHAVAVAHRRSISEAVADALVTTGDARVMRAVAENLGATLSKRAIDVLVDAARFTAELREPVIKRPETSSQSAIKLYWWISQDLRRYALKRYGIAAGQVDQALARTIDDLLGYHQLDKANDKIMGQVADWLAERQAISPRILPQILRLGHFRLFNMLLSRLSGLDLSLIDNAVGGEGGRELAVICRALGIDKPSFVSIFLLSRGARPGDHVVHPRELSQALQSFDHLSTNLAFDLLRSWKQDPSYLLNTKQDVVLEA